MNQFFLKLNSYPILNCFLLAIAFMLTYPSAINFNQPWLQPIILACLINILYQQKSSKKLMLSLLSFCLGFNLLSFYWIPETISTFGGLPLELSYVISLFFSLLVMPQFFITAIIYLLYKKTQLPKIIKNLSFEAKASSLIAVYLLLEINIPSQFPVYLGHSWLLLTSQLGLATIFGASIYSLINLLIAFIFFMKWQFKKWNLFFILQSIILIFTNYLLTPYLVPQEEKIFNTSTKTETLNLRVIQANIGNYMKVASETGQQSSIDQVFNSYFELNQIDSHQPIDLIIWPETAFPFSLNSDQLYDGQLLPTILSAIISQQPAHYMIGGYDEGALHRSANDFHTEYNSVFHFNDQAKLLGVYHKRDLIPFGEGLPFGPFNKFLSQHVPGVSFFSQGSQFNHFTINDQYYFITPICYEILKSHLVRQFLNFVSHQTKTNPHYIINLTNDSWYGQTAEPEQHLFLAKWRAIEYLVPIIRSTNTGITSVIDIDGSESKRLSLGEKGILDLKIPMIKRSATPFQSHGPLFLILYLLLMILIAFKLKKNLPSTDRAI